MRVERGEAAPEHLLLRQSATEPPHGLTLDASHFGNGNPLQRIVGLPRLKVIEQPGSPRQSQPRLQIAFWECF